MAGNEMQNIFFIRCRKWLHGTFEKKTDIISVISVILFGLAGAFKIAYFNQLLVPGADIWMFRYKFLLTVLVLLMVYPILFLFKKRIVLTVFYIVQVIYIIINLAYFLYFKSYLHFNVFISNFYEGLTAVLNSSSPSNPVLLIALLDLPFFICIFILYPRVHRLRKKLMIPVNAVMAISLVITAYTQYGHYRDGMFITQIADSIRLGESLIVQRYGTLVNNIVGIVKSGTEQEYIQSFSYGPETVNETESGNNPDIFIIQVESMESAIVSKKYKDQYIMPFLNSLTTESVYYPYMLSYHFGGGTSDCEFSVINTLEPLTYYPSIKLSSYSYPNSFVKQLTAGSYKAYGFHGNIGRYYNRDVAFHSFGFDEFYDIDEMGLKEVGWGAPDSQVFSFALDAVKDIDAPVLSYVITMSSHGPFTNVSGYYSNPAFSDIDDKKLKWYYNSMAYVDKCIEEYVSEIKKQHDNALIIIFGDHTPQVGNDSYQEAFMIIGDYRYEFVPLFIITPDGRRYREDEIVASFIDIAPTVLNASGVKYRIRTGGTDLLDQDKEAGKIPFRGLELDRREKYRQITEILGNK